MPSLVLALTKPDQTIEFNWDLDRVHNVYLTNFKGTGLAPGNPSFYLRWEHQPHLEVYGNCGTRFPLYFDASGLNGYLGEKGTHILGHSLRFNGSRRLRVVIENLDGTPAQFSLLELRFLCLDERDRPVLFEPVLFQQ